MNDKWLVNHESCNFVLPICINYSAITGITREKPGLDTQASMFVYSSVVFDITAKLKTASRERTAAILPLSKSLDQPSL